MKNPIQVLAALLVIALIIYAALKSGGRRARVAFAPNSANDKDMVVQGWTEAELNRILKKFEIKYRDELGANFSVTLQSEPKGIRLRFPNDIPPDEFQFLVNYIQYPEDFDLSNRAIIVIGSATLGRDFNIPDETLAGKKAKFYVPSHDTDHDVLYVRVGDRTFEDSFAAAHWKSVTDARIPAGLEF